MNFLYNKFNYVPIALNWKKLLVEQIEWQNIYYTSIERIVYCK